MFATKCRVSLIDKAYLQFVNPSQISTSGTKVERFLTVFLFLVLGLIVAEISYSRANGGLPPILSIASLLCSPYRRHALLPTLSWAARTLFES